MLLQEQMIARVRALCAEDNRLDAAMLYGSFAYGEGDAYSDIEFLLFFEDDAFPAIDRRVWLEQIAPVELLFVNEFGILVAIFGNLIRGEFHFHNVSDIATTAQAWPGVVAFPSLDSVLLVDKSGRLAPYVQPLLEPVDRLALPALQAVADGFINWCWFGFNVLRRGEHARALEILGMVHRHLLFMARALELTTDHWLTPSRRVEDDLSVQRYERFRQCTAGLDVRALGHAYQNAWQWGGKMLSDLRHRHRLTLPDRLCERIREEIARGITTLDE